MPAPRPPIEPPTLGVPVPVVGLATEGDVVATPLGEPVTLGVLRPLGEPRATPLGLPGAVPAAEGAPLIAVVPDGVVAGAPDGGTLADGVVAAGDPGRGPVVAIPEGLPTAMPDGLPDNVVGPLGVAGAVGVPLVTAGGQFTVGVPETLGAAVVPVGADPGAVVPVPGVVA